jgi:hypothetical protein
MYRHNRRIKHAKFNIIVTQLSSKTNQNAFIVTERVVRNSIQIRNLSFKASLSLLTNLFQFVHVFVNLVRLKWEKNFLISEW